MVVEGETETMAWPLFRHYLFRPLSPDTFAIGGAGIPPLRNMRINRSANVPLLRPPLRNTAGEPALDAGAESLGGYAVGRLA